MSNYRFLYWEEKEDLTKMKDWVVVDRETDEVTYFETFDEAIHSPIKGHVMSKTYFDFNYKKD